MWPTLTNTFALLSLSVFSSVVTGRLHHDEQDVERRNIGLHGGDDLHSFVTRPDLKPPIYHVAYYNKSQIAPGYWFVSPYNFKDNDVGDIKWETCQIGPTIYDNNGELVWSGACQFPNHIVFNFQMTEWSNGKKEKALTGLVEHANFPREDVGSAFYLGSDYEMKGSILIEENDSKFDMHEWNIQKGGKTALIAHKGNIHWPGEALGHNGKLWIKDDGFREIDLETGEILFEWKVHEHIGLDESTFDVQGEAYNNNPNTNWDPFHLNAVDKSPFGDYIISLRHCDMLVLIDGETGNILWRAGGLINDFELEDGLLWSRQHHVRFVAHNATRTVVSFLDNAKSGSGGQDPTNDFSRGVVIELTHPGGIPSTARLLHHFDRPDRLYSSRRGNLQHLPNGNVWMTWTDDGYVTEFNADAEPIMEARWGKHQRFGTYRGWKMDGWVGRPREKPVAVAHTVQADDVADKWMSTLFVSWNGATEVAAWDFYSDDAYIGRAKRTGFETSFTTFQRTGRVRASALDQYGNVIGQSKEVNSLLPSQWHSVPLYIPKINEKPSYDTESSIDSGNSTVVDAAMIIDYLEDNTSDDGDIAEAEDNVFDEDDDASRVSPLLIGAMFLNVVAGIGLAIFAIRRYRARRGKNGYWQLHWPYRGLASLNGSDPYNDDDDDDNDDDDDGTRDQERHVGMSAKRTPLASITPTINQPNVLYEAVPKVESYWDDSGIMSDTASVGTDSTTVATTAESKSPMLRPEAGSGSR